MQKTALVISAVMLLIFSLPHHASAEEIITVNMARYKDGSHQYFCELLREALKLTGYGLEIKEVQVHPQKGPEHALDTGELSLAWFYPQKKHDKRWVPIDVDLTNAMTRYRVMLIPKGEQKIYEKIQTLDDLRRLKKSAGLALFSFDAQVWQRNHLPNRQPINGANISGLVAAADRGYDYLPVNVREIHSLYKQLGSNLEIEQRLLFVYDHDVRFYLNKNYALKYKAIITSALMKAKENGLIEQLSRKYHAEECSMLNCENRVKISLKTPE